MHTCVATVPLVGQQRDWQRNCCTDRMATHDSPGGRQVERCTSCQYYDRNQRGNDAKLANAGLCRRVAPMLSPLNQKNYMIEGVWPTVRDDDWCGEWKTQQRRVDTSRINEVLNTPLSAPFAANSAQAPRVTAQAARAALGALSGEPPRIATISTLPLTPLPLPNSGNGSARNGD